MVVEVGQTTRMWADRRREEKKGCETNESGVTLYDMTVNSLSMI